MASAPRAVAWYRGPVSPHAGREAERPLHEPGSPGHHAGPLTFHPFPGWMLFPASLSPRNTRRTPNLGARVIVKIFKNLREGAPTNQKMSSQRPSLTLSLLAAGSRGGPGVRGGAEYGGGGPLRAPRLSVFVTDTSAWHVGQRQPPRSLKQPILTAAFPSPPPTHR